MKRTHLIRNSLSIAVVAWLINLTAHAQTTYTWTNLASGSGSGSWATAANWQGGVVAGGADNTADFSTLDISTNSTVTLDGARTIGNLVFGAITPSGTNNWILATGTGGPLTLATSAGQPTLTANNGSNTISAVLLETTTPSGITKAGSGLIRLSSANLVTNAVHNINGGMLQIGNNNALGYTNATAQNWITNNVASGATLWVLQGVQPVMNRAFIAGAGYAGTNGALHGDAGTGNNQNTRWSFALNSVVNPAIILTNDATIRVDGSGYLTHAGFLVGAITNNTSDLAYTLTKTGAAELRIDPAAEIAVAAINVNEGVLGLNGSGNLTRTQAVTVAPGAVVGCRRNNSMNSSALPLVLNGTLELNYNPGASTDTSNNRFTQSVGTLSGNGVVASSISAAMQTLRVQGAADCVFGGTFYHAPNGTNTGPIVLVKNGAGTTLRLTGSDADNGTNIINAGAMMVEAAMNPTGGYIVNGGGLLGGTGVITSPINLNSGGTLVAGDGGGTLAVSNVFGGGDVYVTNASLVARGQLNSSVSGYFNSLNLTNGAITAPLQQNGIEASIYAINLNVDGSSNVLSFTAANPATGQFPFIRYGAVGGLNGFDGLKLVPPAGVSAFLSNNTGNASIDIVVTAIPALVWQGTPTGDWTNGGPANWLNGATASAYNETAGVGPFVIFDDTAPGTANVNVVTDVNPQGITVSSSAKNYTFSGNGAVNASGSILKDGTSTLTFANTASNGIAGTVTINNGALALGNGGAAGNIGSTAVLNSGQVIFNRSDDVTFANSISGAGSLVKNNTNTVTLTGVGNIGGSIAANAGTLALGPTGIITVSGDVTGAGGFGINGAGRVILSSGNVTYSGGSLIAGGGTLEFDNSFPPSGNILDNGTLALGVSGTFNNNISGNGGLVLLNGANITLAGASTYAGPTTVLGSGILLTPAANYSAASALVLGSTNGAADVGAATFISGNPILGGLVAGGNNFNGDSINFGGTTPTLTVNGNVTVGNSGPSGAAVNLPIAGTGVSMIVNTNGGVIQIGLGSTGSGVNPDNVVFDLSGIDNFIANLGTNGIVNLGTVDGNPGPPAGATVVNWFSLAGVSNVITAGSINIGAGGRQLVPELRLGAGTNILNVNTLALGIGGRDGGYLHFLGATGGLKVRGNDGVSRALMNVGVNPATGTGASITNTVDLTGHPVDLLLSALMIGDYNNSGAYENTFSFDTGVLDTLSTSLSVLRNNNGNAAVSGSTLNINGGTANLGPVSLTASAAFGTLNISGATVTAASIAAPGSGVSTLAIANSALNLALTNSGNPASAPVSAQNVSLSGTVNLGISAPSLAVGQFSLIGYIGSLGGDGFPALHLVSLPVGVSAYLSNNVSNLSVDLVVTSAPVTVNPNPTNIMVGVSGNQLTLNWPPDHTGWLLQSNSVSLANTGAWFTVPGSGSTNQLTLTIDPAQTNVFFRMLKP